MRLTLEIYKVHDETLMYSYLYDVDPQIMLYIMNEDRSHLRLHKFHTQMNQFDYEWNILWNGEWKNFNYNLIGKILIK